MITHVIVELYFPIEEKYWEDDDVFADEYYGYGKRLINCRDCKHRMHNGTCIKNMKRKPDDGFCDEGEVKQY